MGYGGDEIYTRSAMRSLQLWKEFFASGNEQLFHETGVLWLAHENDPYVVRTRDSLAHGGMVFETLTRSEIARRYPQIGLEDISWALFEPESGVLMARRAVQSVVHASIEHGVQFLQDSAVALPQKRKFDYLASANGQRISAGVYVFACGPWLPKLFPDVLADRIQPTRQEVFYFKPPEGDCRFTAKAMPTWIDLKGEFYSLPDVEDRGVKAAIDRHGQPFDPDTNDRVTTQEGLAEVRRHLARRLPALKDAQVAESRVCQYENTSNGDFLIDRHPEFENVWLVGGGSGHGFKHAPVVSEYVTAGIEGRLGEVERRFSLETKRREYKRAVY
jgi:glycine/D-amino acid oxidase-like deaminating enzyme